MFRRLLAVLVLLTGLAALPVAAGASVLEGAWDFLFGGAGLEAQTPEEIRAGLIERAEVLKDLGIGPVEDDQLDAVVRHIESIPKEYRDGIDPTLQLLYAVGMGDYDYDTGEWEPSSDRVYAFDTEVYDLNRMYTNFLTGVSAINRDEFSITDVQEDVSQVDWDAGTGTQTIRFTYDGHPYEYAATVNYDWLDMGVVAFMNGVFEAEGNPKRLYCIEYEPVIMFYDTPEWAARFEKATGVALSEAPFA